MKGFIVLIAALTLSAQNSAIQRTIIERKDISTAGREAVVVKVELAPGGFAGRHSHPGEEISYVIAGELELMIEGQPTRIVKPGEAFIIPPGTIHDAHNSGETPVRFAGVYLIDKGKGLVTPAP